MQNTTIFKANIQIEDRYRKDTDAKDYKEMHSVDRFFFFFLLLLITFF
jgi:hypothetical protein